MTRIESLVETAKSSPHLLNTELAGLFETGQILKDDTLSLLLFYLIQSTSAQTAASCLSDVIDLVSRRKGLQSAANVLSRVEVALGFRKPTLGIYDNAFHFIGGAQKYGCTIAYALQDDFDITLIANTDISRQQLEEWYDLDLSECKLKVLKIPYFKQKEEKKGIFDAGEVDLKGDNPFHLVSKKSGHYDIFVNNCMLEMVYPLANISEFVCHFPEREVSRFFHVGEYTHIIFNSRYTADWIKKRWNLEPHVHVYPPVDMESGVDSGIKENVILSASRFEVGGNKQQIEMIKAFVKLCRSYPDDLGPWRLVLVGGSVAENPYLDKVRALLSSLPDSRIELKVNISAEELREVYHKAKLFWHFCGYGQKDPAKFEHFGMTTVEAIQNRCVPVVFNGGGLREIVEHKVSGYLFDDMAGMSSMTLELIQKPSQLTRLSERAFNRGKTFTKEIFVARVREHFMNLLRIYSFQNLDKELPMKEEELE